MNRLSEEQKALHIAQFLHKEMPVRFAHRIIELDNLPHGLSDMPSIKTLRAWYEQGLQDMVSMPIPETLEQEREFHEVASAVYNRHDETLLQVAKGLLEFKKSGKAMEALKSQQHSGIRAAGKRSWPQGHGIGTELSDIADIHNDIDKFLMHRLGIRVVMGQYLALKENAKTVIRQEYDDRQFDDKVGLVQMSVLPADIATAEVHWSRLCTQVMLRLKYFLQISKSCNSKIFSVFQTRFLLMKFSSLWTLKANSCTLSAFARPRVCRYTCRPD